MADVQAQAREFNLERRIEALADENARLRLALATWWETTDSGVPPWVSRLAEECFLAKSEMDFVREDHDGVSVMTRRR